MIRSADYCSAAASTCLLLIWEQPFDHHSLHHQSQLVILNPKSSSLVNVELLMLTLLLHLCKYDSDLDFQNLPKTIFTFWQNLAKYTHRTIVLVKRRPTPICTILKDSTLVLLWQKSLVFFQQTTLWMFEMPFNPKEFFTFLRFFMEIFKK